MNCGVRARCVAQRDFDRGVRRERLRQFEVKPVAETNVALRERGVEHAAFEADGAHDDGRAVRGNEEGLGRRQVRREFPADESGERLVGRVVLRDERDFEHGRREHAQRVVASARQGEFVGDHRKSEGHRDEKEERDRRTHCGRPRLSVAAPRQNGVDNPQETAGTVGDFLSFAAASEKFAVPKLPLKGGESEKDE